MNVPADLLYAKSHEWTRIEGEEAVVGITDFAQEQLGDLTFVELPEVGSRVEPGEEVGTIESVKAASEIYSPVSGEVIAVNTELEDAPELINEDAFGKGWMFRVRLAAQPEGLMDAAAYEQHAAEDH